MQKKFLTGILTLAAVCLFAPSPVKADDTTYTLSGNSYTVSIPADVTISSTNRKGEIPITATLQANTTVSVSIKSQNDFYLKNGNQSVSYSLSDKSPLVFSSGNTDQVENYTVIATAANKTMLYSGEYTDILTFSIFSVTTEPAAEHTLTFDLNANGDSTAAISTGSKVLKQGDAYGALPTPRRTGYDFVGWYTSATPANDAVAATSKTTMQTEDVTLFAKWEVHKFNNTITFWAWGFTDKEGNNGPRTALRLADNYTLTFSTAYGDDFTFKTDMHELDSTLTMPKVPHGYHLKQYGSATNYPTEKWQRYDLDTSSFKQPDNSVNAEYEYDPDEYTITYELGGGVNAATNPKSYTVLYGVTFADPTKEGYTFDGWYKDGVKITGINENCNNESFKEETDEKQKAEKFYTALESRTTGDITVTAHWIKDGDSPDSSDDDATVDSDIVAGTDVDIDNGDSGIADSEESQDEAIADNLADETTDDIASDFNVSDESTTDDTTSSGVDSGTTDSSPGETVAIDIAAPVIDTAATGEEDAADTPPEPEPDADSEETDEES